MPGGRAGLAVNMTTLGLIGSGRIGGTVARLAIDAGYDVVLSNSRGPETLADLCAELGPAARAATGHECVVAGDLVLVSIPLKGYPSLPATAFTGKTVLDTGNYYPERDGQIAALDAKELTDSGYLAEHIPDARVAKVFNNIYFKHLENLARPAGAADRTYLPVAGDEAVLEPVAAFLNAIGYGTVGYAPLAEGWRQQPGTPAYGAPYGTFENEKGTPAGEATIRAALAAATR
jgi:8-hydroxy-5-deazaflavin:NADPH oxidoreductase